MHDRKPACHMQVVACRMQVVACRMQVVACRIDSKNNSWRRHKKDDPARVSAGSTGIAERRW